ncbi:enolase C-terminal domain-like protein [Marinivivus vitaminiproducens]|uniref:enolase C-terminal domain-like protein n=1 Tax=Marinivivus vitaminiproducens TaxID=3035935 RepID=UPI00279FA924|nr:enolase C-terminal domain-like protein [Geminicoccaceae bacterium SCSIO 64248]
MTIQAVTSTVFTYETDKVKDSDGHTHPGPLRTTKGALLTIACEDGTAGHVIASPADVGEDLLAAFVRPVLEGADPLRHEKLWYELYKWQRGSGGRLTDRVLCAVELALWDLIGKRLGQPVWKLVGGYHDKILAYGSTMCGDDIENGLKTPEDYGRFAEWLVSERGYKAVKLHTWMPPIPGAPDVRMDYKACAAVREAVGPDIPLMLDPNHWYSRQDTLWLGKRLEELGFLWMEEPMEEASISSYQWLSSNLALNILGPESMAGKHWTRAEWAAKGACDMIRTGVWDVGGIGPSLKCARVAESFGMSCEVHGTGAGNLAVCAAIQNTTYYERGLLHPFVDYDRPPAYLRRIDDEMDRDGYVHMRDEAGLGQDIDHDYIEANRVA